MSYVVRQGTKKGAGCYLVVTVESIGWSAHQKEATRFYTRHDANRATGWVRVPNARPVRLKDHDFGAGGRSHACSRCGISPADHLFKPGRCSTRAKADP